MQDNAALKLLALILLGVLIFPIWIWLVPWALIEWERENKERHLYDLDQNFELKGGKRNGDNLGTPGPLRRDFKTIPAGR